jgi:CHAD domain-containing protein
MRELELKLSVDDPFVTPALRPDGVDVAGMEELPELDLRATYYDTPDLRLARHGATLRHRTGEGDQAGWHLKLPSSDGDGASREELHFDGPAGKVPAPARDLVTALTRSAPLEPVARLRTLRRRWCLRGSDGSELAELVDDRVSVIKEGEVVERFRELELESHGVDRPTLERIASVLQEAGASAPRPVPKLVRALGPRATQLPDIVAPPQLSPHEPAAYAVQAAIARGVQRVFTNDPGTRLGEVEPLHQMRVGARRLRSDLRTFSPLVEQEWADRLREELRWLGEALGQVRDLDVMQDRLRAAAEGLGPEIEPLFAFLDEQHLVARASLLKALRSERYVKLLDDLVQAARSPVVTATAWEPAGDALPPLAAQAWKRLAGRGRSLDTDDPDERFHQVRIRAKRSRYAADAVAPALDPDDRKLAVRFAKRAAAVQDVLGDLQDSVVARSLVRDVVAARSADAAFALAAGRLLERQEQSAREARAAFPTAWKKLDKPKLRKWFRGSAQERW